MSDETEEFLQHYGIIGMKWGKRSGGLVSRAKGSALDSSQRRQSLLTRAANGTQTKEEKIFSAPARLVLGKKRYQKMAAKSLGKEQNRAARIEAGKPKVRDILVAAHDLNVSSMLVSRRDNKADHA